MLMCCYDVWMLCFHLLSSSLIVPFFFPQGLISCLRSGNLPSQCQRLATQSFTWLLFKSHGEIADVFCQLTHLCLHCALMKTLLIRGIPTISPSDCTGGVFTSLTCVSGWSRSADDCRVIKYSPNIEIRETLHLVSVCVWVQHSCGGHI